MFNEEGDGYLIVVLSLYADGEEKGKKEDENGAVHMDLLSI